VGGEAGCTVAGGAVVVVVVGGSVVVVVGGSVVVVVVEAAAADSPRGTDVTAGGRDAAEHAPTRTATRAATIGLHRRTSG
jgi:hypothetical protein